MRPMAFLMSESVAPPAGFRILSGCGAKATACVCNAIQVMDLHLYAPAHKKNRPASKSGECVFLECPALQRLWRPFQTGPMRRSGQRTAG
eukprot:CAMPEP_0198545046 /NCGR_PEP_ID=MMETSP1462-20131121/62814_1 /TAXON_ID=1333877 /ORGANISM="Brandtodinium nutriculum, Strain RCC3387" /LENGTH=89 /DNA_ID=CAMNT_0044275413 /DNA_START=108 /DNA_END=374 /DNA_ORIENTATION=-